MIIAPIKSHQKFIRELKDIDDIKTFAVPFRIYPDGFVELPEDSEEKYVYSNTKVYIYNKEDEIIKDRFEVPYDKENGWYIDSEYRNHLKLGKNVEVPEGKILEIEHNGFCGFYYLFNSYTKEILIHLFVDSSVSGYRDEANSSNANDPNADYENCYFYTLTDNYLYSNTQHYFYSEAKLKDVQNYAELANFVPKGGMTYDFARTGSGELDPSIHLTGSSGSYTSSDYSMDNKSVSYLYTDNENAYYSNETNYITLNGYTLNSDKNTNVYTGAIVKAINKTMYRRSAIKMDLFKTNRNLNLVYKSPNFKVIKNVIPRLRSVTFETIDDTLNS